MPIENKTYSVPVVNFFWTSQFALREVPIHKQISFSIMTPEQFYQLDEMDQAEVIREGKHVADRQDKDHHILLYKIDDLYVEVYYSKEHNYITSVSIEDFCARY